MTAQKVRQSNFEILRILAMLLIILHHLSVHGPWSPDFNKSWWITDSASTFIIQSLGLFGKTGVNIFVLITGYFMTKNSFKIRSTERVVLESWFYEVAFLLIFYGTHYGTSRNVTVDQMAQALVPIVYSNWFVRTYLALILLSPVLNLVFRRLTCVAYMRLLTLLCVVLSVIPTVTVLVPVLPNTTLVSSNLGWFVFLYLLGGYWRLYGLRLDRGQSVLLAAVCALCLIGWAAYMDLCHVPSLASKTTSLANQYSLFCLGVSVGLFSLFGQWNLGCIERINRLSGAAFDVYLIHDNRFVRPWLWKHFAFMYELGPLQLVIVTLVIPCAIYAVCFLVDYVREHIVERPLLRLLDQKCSRCLDAIDEWVNSMGQEEEQD